LLVYLDPIVEIGKCGVVGDVKDGKHTMHRAQLRQRVEMLLHVHKRIEELHLDNGNIDNQLKL